MRGSSAPPTRAPAPAAGADRVRSDTAGSSRSHHPRFTSVDWPRPPKGRSFPPIASASCGMPADRRRIRTCAADRPPPILIGRGRSASRLSPGRLASTFESPERPPDQHDRPVHDPPALSVISAVFFRGATFSSSTSRAAAGALERAWARRPSRPRDRSSTRPEHTRPFARIRTVTGFALANRTAVTVDVSGPLTRVPLAFRRSCRAAIGCAGGAREPVRMLEMLS